MLNSSLPAISASTTNAKLAIAMQPAARPSSPSVRLTALLLPVRTIAPITTNAPIGKTKYWPFQKRKEESVAG
jgi:hypothetical protein